MTDNVKAFIEKNIGLIESNKWSEVYQKAIYELGVSTGEFTETMLTVDIHPEEYLKNLPPYFLRSASIKNFIIPNSVTKIYLYAFDHCDNLTNVIIPNNIDEIGESAFGWCSSFTDIIIPDSVTSIGVFAFWCCEKLKTIILPDTITVIRKKMLYGCINLTNVTISKYVTNISDGAFSYCGDNLTITYSGTKADWKKIYNPKAFENTYFTVNCTDGKIVKRKR